jgi:hypothetical protein
MTPDLQLYPNYLPACFYCDKPPVSGLFDTASTSIT